MMQARAALTNSPQSCQNAMQLAQPPSCFQLPAKHWSWLGFGQHRQSLNRWLLCQMHAHCLAGNARLQKVLECKLKGTPTSLQLCCPLAVDAKLQHLTPATLHLLMGFADHIAVVLGVAAVCGRLYTAYIHVKAFEPLNASMDCKVLQPWHPWLTSICCALQAGSCGRPWR